MKGCFCSEVVVRSICSHMTQLDRCWWWWCLMSWVRPAVQSGRASNLMYKFDKQIARCHNSQIKILNLFEFPYVPAASTSKVKLQMTN